MSTFPSTSTDAASSDSPPRSPVHGLIGDFDEVVDELFHHLRGRPAADRMFYLASEWADYSKLWHAIGLTMAVFSPERRRDALRLAVALGIESAIVNGGLKTLFTRQRPPVLDNVAYQVRRPRTNSFPSGHASSACLTAVLLSDSMPKLRPLWWTLAAVVAASRIHNRMHHASDVAAGAALGTAMGLVVRRKWPLR